MTTKIIKIESQDAIGNITSTAVIANVPSSTQTVSVIQDVIAVNVPSDILSTDVVTPNINIELPIAQEAIADITNTEIILKNEISPFNAFYELPTLISNIVTPLLDISVPQNTIIASEDLPNILLSLPIDNIIVSGLTDVDYSIELANYGLIYPFDRIISPLNITLEYYHLIDSITFSIGLRLNDSITISDTFGYYKLTEGIPIADSFGRVDILTKALAKGAFNEVKTFNDTKLLKSFGKSLTDTFGSLDSIQLALQMPRTLVDSFNTAETLKLSSGKNLSDTVSLKTTDVLKVSTNKRFIETLHIGESIILIMSILRNYFDFLAVFDYIRLSVNKGMSDQVGISERGLLALQSYCSEDYFAENYVGSYITF